MIQDFKDELLASEPRYRIKDNVGNVLNDNVVIEQVTELVQEGTPLNRATFGNIQGDLYTQDRYNTPTYSGNDMILNLPLTSYEVGKIIKITAPATLTNPTININNLGAKQINGTIEAGGKYELVYNGESWDSAPSGVTVVTGSFGASSSKKTFNLGFTPDIVIAYANYNNYATVAVSKNEADYYYVPRILTKAHISDKGSIIENGFDFSSSLMSGSYGTVYYIAIKF